MLKDMESFKFVVLSIGCNDVIEDCDGKEWGCVQWAVAFITGCFVGRNEAVLRNTNHFTGRRYDLEVSQDIDSRYDLACTT